MRAVVRPVHDDGVVGDAQFVKLLENGAHVLVMVDHCVVILALPTPGLSDAPRFGMRAKVHVCEVHPYEHGLAGLMLLVDELRSPGGDVVIDGFHTFFGERPGIFDLLRAVGHGEAVDHTAWPELFTKFRIFRIVGLLWLLLGIQVV